MALATNRLTAMVAGFWAALPMDYALRIAGVSTWTSPTPSPCRGRKKSIRWRRRCCFGRCG
jgi:hypothetical protein